MVNVNPLSIEVVYACPDRQWVVALSVEVGCTIENAVQRSGLLQQCPDIDLQQQPVGIFGKKASLNQPVKDGDRIEIYRPLTLDPKERRRLISKRRTDSR